jgi:hypothetical protein
MYTVKGGSKLEVHCCLLHVVCLQVKSIEEEEYCLIPMGGVLPTHPQRVLGIGGTAGMVHPSTGRLSFRL